MRRWTTAFRWAWVASGVCAAIANGSEPGDYEKQCNAAASAFQHGRIEEAWNLWEHALGYPDDFDPGASGSAVLSLDVARRRYARLPGIPEEAGRWAECKRIAWYVFQAEKHGDPDTRRQAEGLIADFNEGEEGDCYQEALLELRKESRERREARDAEAKAKAEAECARLRAELDAAHKTQVVLEDDKARLQEELQAAKHTRDVAAKAEVADAIELKAQLDGRDVTATIVAGMKKYGATTPKKVPVRGGKKYRFRMEYMEKGRLYAGEVLFREGMAKVLVARLSEVSQGTSKTITLPGGATMDFVWCPPGSFKTDNPKDKGWFGAKQKTVAVTNGFWIAKTEVTQKQWLSVMERNPSTFVGEDNPVEGVELGDCREFCLRTGLPLALPSEEQWEYACRAGSTGDFGGTGRMASMGWYEKNSYGQTHPVGGMCTNDWGLFDMHGNVWEWCENGMRRGGSWNSKENSCRSATRFSYVHQDIGDLGFRPVMSPP